MDSLTWIIFWGVVAQVCIVFVIGSVVKKIIDARRAKNAEENRFQQALLSSELFERSPQLFVKLEGLIGNYRITTLGIKSGWLPFVLICFIAIAFISPADEGSKSDIYILLILVSVLFSLMVFYGFLFKRAFDLKAKISAAKLEISAESQSSLKEVANSEERVGELN